MRGCASNSGCVSQAHLSASLVVLTVFLTSCSLDQWAKNGFKVGPEYATPNADVAATWIDANDERLSSTEPDVRAWWSAFGDPTLDALVASAQDGNLTLREAGQRVLEARAVLGIAVGELFPQEQGAQGGFSRTEVSERQFGDLPIPYPKRTFSNWNVGFGLSWEIDFWGRFRRAVESAEARLDASVDQYDDVLVTLAGDVATRYVELRTIESKLAIARSAIVLQTQTLDIAKAKYEGGDVSQLDVDQAAATLAKTEASIPQLLIEHRIASDSLCVLLGLPAQDLQSRLGAGAIPVAPPTIAIGIPADLLRRRPDVRREERLAAAQCAKIGIAESDFYPAISLGGSLGFSAEDLSDLFSGNSFTGSFGPSFQWKLLDYGRTASNVRRQQAAFEAAVASYRQAVLKANAEVENGLVRFLESQARVASLRSAVASTQSAVDIALLQYKEGTVDFNRVSLLEQDLLEVQDLEASARGEIARGLIDTYRALGGGWQQSAGDANAPENAVSAQAN